MNAGELGRSHDRKIDFQNCEAYDKYASDNKLEIGIEAVHLVKPNQSIG